MRGGLILCERECKEHSLVYPFNEQFLSVTKGPSLETPWGEGSFSPAGYRFATGQGLRLAEGRCLTEGDAYSVYVRASLDVTTGWKRIFGTPGWGDNGYFVNKFFRTFPVRRPHLLPNRLPF